MKFLEGDKERLKKLGVSTLLDLALIVPKSYNDYTLSSKIIAESFHTLKVTIKDRNYNPRYMRLTIYAHNLDQELKAIVFHPKQYHSTAMAIGKELYLYGKIEYQYNSWQLTQPQIIEEPNLVVPKYKRRLQNKTVFSLMKQYLTKEAVLAEGIDEDGWQKLESIHFADSSFVREFEKNEGFNPEIVEFLKYLEIYNHLKKLSSKKVRYKAKKSFDSDISAFINSLPFELTSDQLKVIEEIRADLRGDIATRRVVMGDVGCGKTMVIFASVMMAKGSRSLLMAPTTVLAKQIYEEAKKFLPSSLNVALVTNKSKEEDLSEYDFIIGTHALLFRELPDVDLVMVDEQHRFGTKQRNLIEKLVSSGEKRPHYIQFSATPIPRTYSMIQSSIIDISTIKQMPYPKDIDTKIITKKDFNYLLDHIKREISQDKQIIIVYPLVQESEAIDYQSIDEARGYWEKNFDRVFVTYGKDKEKEEVLEQFAKEGSILLATTLIEVGISLPKLSTIVLVAPERLGLATLHQLRGRVSRNGVKGYCFLFTKQESSKRLKDFCKTTNGFEIAELDLKYRQGGDLLRGDIQSGKHFKWFDPSEDEEILRRAKGDLC